MQKNMIPGSNFARIVEAKHNFHNIMNHEQNIKQWFIFSVKKNPANSIYPVSIILMKL